MKILNKLLIRLSDSRDKNSVTLGFVFVAENILFLRFLLGGLTLPALGSVPITSATEFGLAFTTIAAVWLGREILDTKVKDKDAL